MATKLEQKLAKLKKINSQREQTLDEIKEARKKQYLPCRGCDKKHQIGKLEAIQTHWYTQPQGCAGGDHWNVGELQFICPTTGIRNRILFDTDDVPWEERKNYRNDPEAQFRQIYKPLFADVQDEYEERTPKPWKNNYHVDQNREKFGLVEKRS